MTPRKFNEWRIIPRFLILSYGIYCLYVGNWYMQLASPSTEQTTFVTVVVGAAAVWFNFYTSTGNKGGIDLE